MTGRYILVRPRWAGNPAPIIMPEGLGFGRDEERLVAAGTYDAVNAAAKLMEMRDG